MKAPELSAELLERLTEMEARGTIPLRTRVRELMRERGISVNQMMRDTGLAKNFLYRDSSRPHRSRLMALAYYFDITVEELVDGTDAYNEWYRVWEE
jgi:transcriptional regulator with XRE-family HTH domain